MNLDTKPSIRPQRGRNREATELIDLKRAALVGRMLLGELHSPFAPVNVEELSALTRSDLRQQLIVARRSLKGEIEKFCRNNFDGLTIERLAALYEPLEKHGGSYRIPLVDFIKEYAAPRERVLKGAPLHATIAISPWGLQTEFPESHLAKDIMEAIRQAVDCTKELKRRKRTGYREAKDDKEEIGAFVRQKNFALRAALIGSFNLVEAYINGVAWEYLREVDPANVKQKDSAILHSTARAINIKDKLTKIPRIVKGTSHGVLHESRDPLKTFVTTVRPFRDSIVHASPFSAPQKFGGYDRLENLYNLDLHLVTVAIESAIEIVSAIHMFLTDCNSGPSWLPQFSSEGYLEGN